MKKIFNIELSYLVLLPAYLGILRWIAYVFLKIIPALLYRPYTKKDKCIIQKYKTTDVTIISPLYCFDDDFEEICLESWLRNKPGKIILASDSTCYQSVCQIINKIDAGKYPDTIVEVLNIHKPGKRQALYEGYLKTNTEIICFVDDDVFHHDDFLENLLLPFNDKNKNMGGVSCKQLARPQYKQNWTSWDIMLDMRLYQRMMECRATTFFGGGSTCLSGRTMCFRKKLFDDQENFKESFLGEMFMGRQQLSGDDKCLTRMCINSQYDMYHQISEKSYLTTKFEDPPVLFSQILRWSRNTWRSDFKLLFLERKVWKKYPFLSIIMLDRFISPFSILLGPIFVIISYILTKNTFVLLSAFIYLLVSRSIKLIHYFLFDTPRRPFRWVLLIPSFILLQYYTAWLKVYALFTLDNRRWGNRPITCDSNNVIVRTGDKAEMEEIKIEDFTHETHL